MLVNFLNIHKDLRYCPICAFTLYVDILDKNKRMCHNHGNIFTIKELDGGRYHVEVNLADDSF